MKFKKKISLVSKKKARRKQCNCRDGQGCICGMQSSFDGLNDAMDAKV